MVSGSIVFGWPVLVVLGFFTGLMAQKERPWVAAGLTAIGSWSLILIWRTLNDNFPILMQSLQSIVNVPGWALIVVTLCLAGILAATGANFGLQIRRLLQKRSDDSSS